MNDTAINDVWPATAPAPTKHPYQCYDLHEKNPVARYREKYGEAPAHVVTYRRLVWLGPKPKKG